MDESAMPHGPPATVAILAVPEASASVIYGMYDLFRSAGRDWNLIVEGAPGAELLRPLVVARESGTFGVGNGVRITPELTLEACPPPDIVCVPEVLVAPDVPPSGQFDVEVRWLRDCYDRGAIVATACSGALLLAEAGLLKGVEATTHWAFCDLLRRHYPGVRVREQAALVASGEGQRLVMAGGGTSWLDLTLYLIARATNVEIAMQTARVFLIDWHDVGQQPFASLARARQVDDAVIARCQVWIAEHYAEAAPVAAMVRMSGLPERTFKRRFRHATGLGPLEYVHTVRLEEAKQMLEAENAPVETVAHAVGYEDAGFFNRLFRRKVGLTPGQYRRRFGALRRRLGSC
jgi:transcriptional regulator GlxA family with amidase domain